MAAFFKHHVFEECKAAVPGFLSGEVLLSMADADELQISVLWSNQRAWQTWQDSQLAEPGKASAGPRSCALIGLRSTGPALRLGNPWP